MGKTAPRWVRWFRRLCVAAIVALLLVTVARDLIAPAIVRWQLRQAAAKYWAGSVDVDQVEFHFWAPIRLHNIELRDEQGRLWATIDHLTAGLRNWPGMHPVLTDLKADNVELRFQIEGGECRLPILSPPEGGPSQYVDIQTAAAGRVVLSACQDGLVQVLRDRCRLTGTFDAGGGEFSLVEQAPGSRGQLCVRGLFRRDANSMCLDVKFSDQLQASDANVILSIFRVPLIAAASGRVSIHLLAMTGADRPSATFQAQATLRDGLVLGRGGPLIEGLAAEADFTEDGGPIRVSCLRSCQGKLTAEANVQLLPGLELGEYRGTVQATKVDMPEMLRSLATRSEMMVGDVSWQLAFAGRGADLAGFRAKGQLRMERAHLSGIPVLRAVLEYVHLGDMGNFKIVGQFAVRGPVLTVELARATNPLSALDILPAGTINLQTKQIDVHMVATLLSEFKSNMEKLQIPLVSTMVGLTGDLLQHLTRIRVRGKWTEPAEDLVHKDIAQDLADGTVKFFTDAAKGGDEPADGTFKSFDELFKSLNGNGANGHAASQPATSQAKEAALGAK